MNCEQPGCEGHLGKFDSCRDEALYALALDGMSDDGQTGSTDFQGHFTLILLDEPFTHDQGSYPIAGGESVVIPPGSYIVQSHTSGAVSVGVYETPEKAREVFAEAEAAYDAYDNDELEDFS